MGLFPCSWARSSAICNFPCIVYDERPNTQMDRSSSVVSSEKTDMNGEKTDTGGPHRAGGMTVAFPSQCVWTNQPVNTHSCRARVPAGAVSAAWRRELDAGRTAAGFFHFAWNDRVWLAYGLPDGSVRGVYCPVHRAEREERLGYDPELARPPSTNAAADAPARVSAALAG